MIKNVFAINNNNQLVINEDGNIFTEVVGGPIRYVLGKGHIVVFGVGGGVGPVECDLLLQSSGNLLLQSSGNLLLQECFENDLLLETGGDVLLEDSGNVLLES